MKRFVTLSSLSGSFAMGFDPVGSEMWGIMYTDIVPDIYVVRRIGFLSDPIFRKPNKLLKQRMPTRHCDNLQLEGSIVVNLPENSLFDDVQVYDRSVSLKVNGVWYIPCTASGELDLSERGTPGGAFRLIWESQDMYNNQFITTAAFISQRGDEDLAWWYGCKIRVDSSTRRAELMFITPSTHAPSFSEAEKEARLWIGSNLSSRWVWAGADPMENGVPSIWESGDIQFLTPDQIEAVVSAFNSLEAGSFNAQLRSAFDFELFYRAIDRFRPRRLSFFETVVGYAELPAAVQSIVESMYALAGRAVPATIGIKALIGLYLCYIYALRPIPEDAKIMRSWLGTLSSYTRFDGQRIQSQSGFSWDGWIGTQIALIQLLPIMTDVPPDLNDAFDRIEEDRPLRVSDSFALVPRAGRLDLDMVNLSDVLPIRLADLSEDLWNTVGYSFVYDWGLDLGGQIERWGLRSYLSMLPVSFSCQTVKATKDITDEVFYLLRPSSTVRLAGKVRAIKYERSYSDTVPDLPPFKYEPTSISSVWMQGTALLLQRVL